MVIARRAHRRAFAAFRYTVLTGWLAIAVFPLYWMIATSFKTPAEWFAWPPVWWPAEPTLVNWIRIWVESTFVTGAPAASDIVIGPWTGLANSLVIAMTASIVAVGFGAFLAYGVARYAIVHERKLYYLLMLRMVPPFIYAAPLTLWYSAIALKDTLIGLIFVYALTTLPYAALILKSFIDEMPRELEQAAAVLGARRVRIIWEVIVPQLRAGLIATFLFIFILNWSEYYLALFLSSTEVTTLAIQLSRFEGNSGGHGLQAALSVGATLPLIAIGIAIRRYLVRGLGFGMVRRAG